MKSDVVTFDVLVGCDFYHKIVNPHKLPRQVYGMWLLVTHFGQHMLCGKIPGSAMDKSKQNVNYVNIQKLYVVQLP